MKNKAHFPSDGSNHKNGVKNEVELKTFLEQKQNLSKIFPHLANKEILINHTGGKNGKTDLELAEKEKVVESISVKLKKAYTGTTDWHNDSADTKTNIETSPAFKPIKTVCEWRDKNFKKATASTVAKARKLVSDAANDTLNNFTDADIRQALQSMINRCSNHTVIFIVKSDSRLYKLQFSELQINSLIKDSTGQFFLKSKSKAKGSRSVFFLKEDGSEIDTGIRFRLHLNNGVSAWLGKGEKSKSSVWCFKCQQDSFQEIKSKATVYDYQ